MVIAYPAAGRARDCGPPVVRRPAEGQRAAASDTARERKRPAVATMKRAPYGRRRRQTSSRLGQYLVILVEIDVEYARDLSNEIVMVIPLPPQDVDRHDDVETIGQALFGIVLYGMLHELSPFVGATQ